VDWRVDFQTNNFSSKPILSAAGNLSFCLCLFDNLFGYPKLSAVKLLGEIYLIGLAVLSFNLINTVEKLKKFFRLGYPLRHRRFCEFINLCFVLHRPR
jgi:hypothetical protein